ncbi:MAG: shikimate kinase [Acidimicrobiia bacterium]|nr:shikimate kinase [Acidimicrobiia bacterium]
MNLWLIGMMGSGKTTVGRLAAANSGLPFRDVDLIVQERLQRSIAELWEAGGEDAFRAIESTVVEELAGAAGAVVSTGGGAVLNLANRNAMRRSGTVVWLTASPAVLASRVVGDRERPLLGSGGEDRLAQLLAGRIEHYTDVADHTVSTEGRTPAEVAEEVGQWL